MSRVCGVYEIRNVVNGKSYVGSSNNVRRRLTEHKRYLRNGVHHCVVLQRAWEKYGASAFEFRLLAVLEPHEQFLTEQRLLTTVYSARKHYNTGLVATAAMSGRTHSAETLAKMRDGSRRGANNPSYGLKRSDETRALQRALKIGKPAHNKGTKHTAESIQKIRDALKGRVSWRKGVRLDVCKQGHPLTEENVYVRKDRGTRSCKICNSRRTSAYVARQRKER